MLGFHKEADGVNPSITFYFYFLQERVNFKTDEFMTKFVEQDGHFPNFTSSHWFKKTTLKLRNFSSVMHNALVTVF